MTAPHVSSPVAPRVLLLVASEGQAIPANVAGAQVVDVVLLGTASGATVRTGGGLVNVVVRPGAVDVDAILKGQVYDLICDATELPWQLRDEVFLSLYPAVSFGGQYVFATDGTIGDACLALGSAIATATTEPSLGAVLEGQSAFAYAQNVTVGVALEHRCVRITKMTDAGPAQALLSLSPAAVVAEHVEEVFPEEQYRRSPPHIENAPADLDARIAPVIARGGDTGPAGRIARLRDVTIYGDGILRHGDTTIVAESLLNIRAQKAIPGFFRISSHTYATLPWLRRRNRLIQPNLVLLKQAWAGNYGHWLIEILPRLAVLAERMPLAECHYILHGWERHAVPVFKDSMRWCGIPEDRLLITHGDPIDVAELYFPLPVGEHPWIHSPFVIRFLEELAARVRAATHEGGVVPETVAPQRVYLSRNRFGSRLLLNEGEVMRILDDRGYRVIHPEQMTFTEQVLALSNARFVVGNLGAGMTNAVFARRGVRMLALVSERMGDDFFWDIVSQKDGHYFALHGAAQRYDLGGRSDFTIDIARFKQILSRFDPT